MGGSGERKGEGEMEHYNLKKLKKENVVHIYIFNHKEQM